MSFLGLGGGGSNPLSGAAGSGSTSSVNDRKSAVMERVKREMDLAGAQELIQKMTECCYAKCLPKPGSTFTSGDQSCTAKCMDRYLEAWNIVSNVYLGRIKQASGNVDGGLI